MIATQTLIDRLEHALTHSFVTATVAPLLDFDPADADALRNDPLIWISLATEDAESNTLNVGISQRVTATFSLVIAAPDAAAVDAIRALVQTTFINWEPTGAIEPLTYAGGGIADLTADLLWWEDRFTTAYHIRQLT
jgi:hypothetical protein